MSFEDWLQGFKNPPREYGPTPIWWWSGAPLEVDRLCRQIDRMQEGGVHQAIIMNLAPSGPMYGSKADDPLFMSDAWWEIFRSICSYAQVVGFGIWFYDQIGFSGADFQSAVVREEPQFAGQFIGRQGASIEIYQRGFDYTNPDACSLLIDRVHGEFERKVGEYLGTTIRGSFQDELPNMPTWSPRFESTFAQRYGYEIGASLEKLFDEDSKFDALRVAYHEHRAYLVENAFFVPLCRWHEDRGLLWGCDQQGPARSGDIESGVIKYADYARTHRWFSVPGSDHHGNATIHDSLRAERSNTRVWIESFHSTGWGGTLAETYDWLIPWFLEGASLYNPHAVYYSIDNWWEWAPPSTCWRQPYWPHYSRFSEAVARSSVSVSTSRREDTVLVVIPVSTVQAGVHPDTPEDLPSTDAEKGAHSSALGSDNALESARHYHELVGSTDWGSFRASPLREFGIGYALLNEKTLENGSVDESGVHAGELVSSIVVLPAISLITSRALKSLDSLVAAGGTVLCVGKAPVYMCHGTELIPVERDWPVYPSAHDVAKAIAELPDIPVHAPDVSVRETDWGFIELLPGAFPGGTTFSERSRWFAPDYSFDPGKYHQSRDLSVPTDIARVELLDPATGSSENLPVKGAPGSRTVSVPQRGRPLLIAAFIRGSDAREQNATAPGVSRTPDSPVETDDRPVWKSGESDLWDVEYVLSTELATDLIETWELHDEAGVRHKATYGARAEISANETASERNRELSYSESYGIDKDSVHTVTLGPKGRIPEAFLDIGTMNPGEEITVRSTIELPKPASLVFGSNVALTVFSGTQAIPLSGAGHQRFTEQALGPGPVDLQMHFTNNSSAPRYCRAYWHGSSDSSFEKELRPELMTLPGGSALSGEHEFSIPLPGNATHLSATVTSVGAARVMAGDTVIGLQGGNDPYGVVVSSRQYSHSLRPTGDAEIFLRVAIRPIGDAVPSLLIDGTVETDTGTLSLLSNGQWTVISRGCEPAFVELEKSHENVARPSGGRVPEFDISGYYHYERTSPLRRNMDLGIRATAPATVHRANNLSTQTLKWIIPPGTTTISIFPTLPCVVSVDKDRHECSPGIENTIRISPPAGSVYGVIELSGLKRKIDGSLLDAPIRHSTGPAKAALGSWRTMGLHAFAGGLLYRRVVPIRNLKVEHLLKLGDVRGTVGVKINGIHIENIALPPFECRIPAEYLEERTTIELTVLATLGPYMDSKSPTRGVAPIQLDHGLYGPVELLELGQ